MEMTLTKNLGMLILGLWLILYGINALFVLGVPGLAVILGALALVAGILILLGR
jgi:hypothetical protein